MDKKERIHEEADRIFNRQKDNYSVTEMVILVQSQYYNIEDMFTYGANLKSDDINEHIAISERIFSICNSFQKFNSTSEQTKCSLLLQNQPTTLSLQSFPTKNLRAFYQLL